MLDPMVLLINVVFFVVIVVSTYLTGKMITTLQEKQSRKKREQKEQKEQEEQQRKEQKKQEEREEREKQLKIKKESYFQLNDEKDRVIDFLNRIQENPDIEGHLLLLEGPPGTGKTSLVLDYLIGSDYSIHQWLRGTEQDMYVHNYVSRLESFFKTAQTQAQNSRKLQILFIDEIQGVIFKTEGTQTEGLYSYERDNTAFLTAISALRGTYVVLIGTTNNIDQFPAAFLSRAGANRIYFPLPTELQRKQLLTFFFRDKRVNTEQIDALSKKTIGYSTRDLLSFVQRIDEQGIDAEHLGAQYKAHLEILQRDFKAQFEWAEIYRPVNDIAEENELERAFVLGEKQSEQMTRLVDESPDPLKKHTLAYGPPGGGKTTLMRIMASQFKGVLFAVFASPTITPSSLEKLFAYAKAFGNVIVFIDEIELIATEMSPHKSCLLNIMDGISKSNITIVGATNTPERLAPAILDRFTCKLFLCKLDASARNLPIKHSLLKSIQSYQDNIYFDEALAAEMQPGAIKLATTSDGLSWRSINAAIGYLLGDLKRGKPEGYAGITFLRLQDLLFSITLKQIQEKIVRERQESSSQEEQTLTQYIRKNRALFFPTHIPKSGISAKEFFLGNSREHP